MIWQGVGVDIYPVSKIEEDIKNLTQKTPCRDILEFRNKYIAHFSKIKYIAPPTYGILFKTFELLDAAFKKYNSIMNVASMHTMTPEPEGYWQQPLTVAWMEKNQKSK